MCPAFGKSTLAHAYIEYGKKDCHGNFEFHEVLKHTILQLEN
jgi:hypothetical protein